MRGTRERSVFSKNRCGMPLVEAQTSDTLQVVWMFEGSVTNSLELLDKE
jgi:hypothetical protein